MVSYDIVMASPVIMMGRFVGSDDMMIGSDDINMGSHDFMIGSIDPMIGVT